MRPELVEAQLGSHAERLVRRPHRLLGLVHREPEPGGACEHPCLRARRGPVGEERGGVLEACGGLLASALADHQEVGEQDLGLGGELDLARVEERGRRLGERVAAGAFGVEQRLAVAEEEPRPLGVVLGPRGEGLPVEANRGRVGGERERAVAGLEQCPPRALRQVSERLAGGPGELERAQVVVGDQVGEIFGAVACQAL